MRSFFHRAFTLIELMVVVAIIGILLSVLTSMSGKPPKGLEGATQVAQGVFDAARAQAMLGQNPDPNPQPNATIKFLRSRVIILNDPADPDSHLRRMGVIIGGYTGADGTRSERNLTEADITWFAKDQGVSLPQGFYFVANADANITAAILRSDAVNKTMAGPGSMRIEYPSRAGQPSGAGRNWYYYEFLSTGAVNMTDNAFITGARFTITEGALLPGATNVTPANPNVVGGFILLRPGTTVMINQKYTAP